MLSLNNNKKNKKAKTSNFNKQKRKREKLMANIDKSNQDEKNINAEKEFSENLKQLEEQARIEGIKLKIKEEIRILEERKRSVQIQYSYLSNSAVKEKKDLDKFIVKFDLEINELNKKYRMYDKNK